MEQKDSRKSIPVINSKLRSEIIEVPEIISKCSGIRIQGKRIKSIIFTTDIAIIMNNNADAVLAVYPFTPHPAIIQAIASVSTVPVFAGVGGGTTGGPRSAQMAIFAEAHGALGVVVNAPTTLETIHAVADVVDIPLICTIVSEYMDIASRLEAGITVLNVSGGARTAQIVRSIRQKYTDLPIIATGGPTEESILETIEAGANAITYTPPTNGELFKKKMDKYRNHIGAEHSQHHILS